MNDMPPGTRFTYLGRPAVVLRIADESEAADGFEGFYGHVYEYVDERGQIHKRCVAPRDFDAFRAAVEIGGSSMVVFPEAEYCGCHENGVPLQKAHCEMHR